MGESLQPPGRPYGPASGAWTCGFPGFPATSPVALHAVPAMMRARSHGTAGSRLVPPAPSTAGPCADPWGPCGGIGRRDRLKICFPQGSACSSQARGTNTLGTATASAAKPFFDKTAARPDPTGSGFDLRDCLVTPPHTPPIEAGHAFAKLPIDCRLVLFPPPFVRVHDSVT